MIKDFTQNEVVTAFLAIRRKEVKEYNGNVFISFEFGDASGRIAGVWWEPDRAACEESDEGAVVKVKGTVGVYRNRLQLKVMKMRPAKEGEYNMADILPHSEFSSDELKARIFSYTERVENTYVKSLLLSFWNDGHFLNAYLNASGGKMWHHSYIGGLAEHSLNVTQICLDMAQMYDFLDRDILIFGGLFHDAGKAAQYKITSYIDYSDEGRLIGHISLADSLVAQRASQIDSFPASLLMKLRHVILAHHGQIEFASPVLPQIPEAFILYYADEVDSKMGALERIREKSGGKGWSEYINLLNRHIYFGEK
jgi:3'-5' exoribonuclease